MSNSVLLMTFKLEIDLVDAFRDHLDLFLPAGKSIGLCKTEKSVRGRRFTDLMLGDFDGVLSNKERRHLPKVTSWLQQQLARTTKKPTTPEKLCEGFVSRTQARRLKQLGDLVRWGFMNEFDDGTIQTSEDIQTKLPTQTVAFEAKLKDWKGAIKQAKNYRRFSHSSWVVMPEKFIDHEALISGCEDANIGLAVLGINGLRKVVPAPIANDTIPRRTLRFNLLVDYARHGTSDRWFFVE